MTTPFKRTYWVRPGLDDPDCQGSDDMDEDQEDRQQVATAEESNLTGSLVVGAEARNPDALHLPVIDLDLPCELRPSSTPGHHHLYVDHPIPWVDYVELLNAMAKCGLVEQGYVDASVERGQTFVRTRPTKPQPAPPRPKKRLGWADLIGVVAAVAGVDREGPTCSTCGLNAAELREACIKKRGIPWHGRAGKCGHCCDADRRLANSGKCFDCGFWLMQLANPDGRAVIGGIHYRILPETSCNPEFKGMGGARHVIRFLDGRTPAEVITTNLWYQGEIPERLRDRLPDNAEFVHQHAESS